MVVGGHGTGHIDTPNDDSTPASEPAPDAPASEVRRKLSLASTQVTLVPPVRIPFESPEDAVYIGRGCSGYHPSQWMNPFRVATQGRSECIRRFRLHLRSNAVLQDLLPTLSARRLRCHCSLSEVCHGDALIDEWEKWASRKRSFRVWSIPAGMSSDLIQAVLAVTWPQQKRSHVTGLGKCLGLTSTPTGKFVCSYRADYERIVILARRLLTVITGIDPKCTSLQVNIDTVSELHSDAGNSGWSYMICCGQFQGGAFVLGQEWPAQDSIFHFNGAEAHASTEFVGQRLSLVFFVHSLAASLEWWERETLCRLGFWRDGLASKSLMLVHTPWDRLIDPSLEVLKRKQEVQELARSAKNQSWGPNCATFSRAREIPVPGARWAPEPLRSEEEPEGFAHCRHLQRVQDDTECADLSANECSLAVDSGRFFLEHPSRSIAHFLRSWQSLRERPGVMKLDYHACLFPHCTRRKFQSVTTNAPLAPLVIPRSCPGADLCLRTGEEHGSWRPLLNDGSISSFPTGGETEYPWGFCEVVALTLNYSDSSSFVEFFAGPNAPLSMAVRLEAAKLHAFPWPIERPRLRSVSLRSSASSLAVPREPAGWKELLGTPVVCGTVVDLAVDSAGTSHTLPGKQARWNSSSQLLSDEIVSPAIHVAAARRLVHPMAADLLEDKWCGQIARSLVAAGSDIAKRRWDQVQRMQAAKASAGSRNRDLRDAAGVAFKAMESPLDLGFIEWMMAESACPDRNLAQVLAMGLPLTGEAATSPLLEFGDYQASISVTELLMSAPKRRDQVIEAVLAAARRCPEAAAVIWRKTLEEVEQKQAIGPLEYSDVVTRHGNAWVACRRWALQQGVSDSGAKKWRLIDDHADSRVNAAARRRQKLQLDDCAMLARMARSLARVLRAAGMSDTKIMKVTEDWRHAYKQIAVQNSHLSLNLVAVAHPTENKVVWFQLWVQPFGALHAVFNFYRLAAAINWACRSLLELHCGHYFDDNFAVEPDFSVVSAQWALRSLFQLAGIVLDPGKSQEPEECQPSLGVVFNFTDAVQKGSFAVEPKASRVHKLCEDIDGHMTADSLSPSAAARLAGKADFACSTLFGRTGRAFLSSLKARQYSECRNFKLTTSLKASMRGLQLLLRSAPRHFVAVDPPRESPVLIYVDGAAKSGDMQKAGDTRIGDEVLRIGAVCLDGKDIECGDWLVPTSVSSRWKERKLQVWMTETLAAPVAIMTWRERLANRSSFVFVDNNGALAALVKGYSGQLDGSELIAFFWVLAARCRISLFLDRVPSPANIADGPSRGDYALLERMGARRVTLSTKWLDLLRDDLDVDQWLSQMSSTWQSIGEKLLPSPMAAP